MKMYNHIFGPVPSRRLGMSLGVDLVPKKVCTFNCIYCECGATNLLTRERSEFVSAKLVIEELNDYFKHNPDPDYITFSGAGEPTLNSKIGEIINYIKNNFSNIQMAVLTNGCLLSDKQVRKELLQADLILPSLDSAQLDSFNKIDRPVKDFNLDEYINGMVQFRFEYSGKIWLEVMIIPGYNDDLENLKHLKNAIVQIKPDKIQLNTLDRPGDLKNIRAATKTELEEIKRNWNLPHIEIIAKVDRKTKKSYRKDVEQVILETISRRPCTIEDIEEIVGLHPNEINKYLEILNTGNYIQSSIQERGVFYYIKE
jgi:wyosine [tRNA(Phe)-imidazoG37] synthetase (radical SAM superfamily)